ncbi:MFS transporter, partial [Paenibacillus macerans]|uniref:MFS transporter n=1 Tax=Paenibacillus macerans TaxID=44252 RepID=UPI002E23662D
YFDVSFMIWVLIGPLAVIMMQDYPMSASQKANLVALPVLGGSVLRLVLGVLADRIGPKLSGQIGMIVTMIPLIYGWQVVSSLGELFV